MGTRKPAPRIFISYRRADSSYVVDVLYERLVAEFGKKQVFRDIHGLRAGADFRTYLPEAVRQADVVLAPIGKRWCNGDTKGNRLLLPDDFVRIEIEEALRLAIPVVPLLLEGTALPQRSKLPLTLRPLLSRHAFVLRSGRDRRSDLTGLCRELRRLAVRARSQRATVVPDGPSAERVPVQTTIIPPKSPSRLGVQSGLVELIYMRGGKFRSAAAPRGPTRVVGPFYLAREPVTIQVYERFVRGNPRARRPRWWPRTRGALVDAGMYTDASGYLLLTREEAEAFAQSGGARLPTADEWRYAVYGIEQTRRRPRADRLRREDDWRGRGYRKRLDQSPQIRISSKWEWVTDGFVEMSEYCGHDHLFRDCDEGEHRGVVRLAMSPQATGNVPKTRTTVKLSRGRRSRQAPRR